MSRYETKKVLKYVKTSSVSKLRYFIRKHDVDLNKIRDSEARGLLHLACYLGHGRVARWLLRRGVDPCAIDCYGNTPLHTALEYALEFNNESAFLELVLPLKKKSKRVMHLKNSKGDTPEELLVKLKSALRKDLFLDCQCESKEKGRKDGMEDCNNSRDNWGKQSRDVKDKEEQFMNKDSQWEDREEIQKEKHGWLWHNGENWQDEKRKKREEENEWLEKLAFENSCEDFYFKEDSPLAAEEEQETYSQWADRLRAEYNAKRTSVQTKNYYQNKQDENVEKEKTAEKLTKKLAKEHEEYFENIRLKCKAARISREREKYEQNCKNVFENEPCGMLRFSDIPWPCNGSAVDMVENLKDFAGNEDPVKYLKTQRIRWHPDRFLSRCQHKLTGKDKEAIFELVKQISQGLNALITSL